MAFKSISLEQKNDLVQAIKTHSQASDWNLNVLLLHFSKIGTLKIFQLE